MRVSSDVATLALALSATQLGAAKPIDSDPTKLVARQQGGGGPLGGLLSGITGLFGGPAQAPAAGGKPAATANKPAASGAPAAGDFAAAHGISPEGGIQGLVNSFPILLDHFKFTRNPQSALNEIPPSQNSQPREMHREAHVRLAGLGEPEAQAEGKQADKPDATKANAQAEPRALVNEKVQIEDRDVEFKTPSDSQVASLLEPLPTTAPVSADEPAVSDVVTLNDITGELDDADVEELKEINAEKVKAEGFKA